MHVTLNLKHALRDENLEELFEREQSRIVRRLRGIALDRVSIHCEIDRSTHHKEAEASLTLNLPTAALNARSTGRTVLAALRRTTNALLVELTRHRRQHREGRHARPFLDAPAVVEDKAHTIRKTLAELYSFVRRELQRHREVLGEPELGAVEVPDVVEEAVLRALATAEQRSPDVPFDRWLLSCAYDVLVDVEEDLRQRGVDRSLEDEVEPDPREDDLDVTEEILRASPPSSYADTIPARDGQAEFTSAEDHRGLHDALMEIVESLDAEEREALQLVAFEGLTLPEAAERIGCTEEHADARVAGARRHIRARLEQLGFTDAS